jgi:TolB-like protein/tetratricopeptide (TPR) repeat protein
VVVDPSRTEFFRAYLDQLLSSSTFAGSRRRAQLLRYLVDRKLAGEEDRITEYGIGLDVFGKPASFDPRTEATVRVEMSRLRKSLSEYYADAGSGDPWKIEFPTRGYVPEITAAANPAAAQRGKRLAPSWVLWTVLGLVGAVAMGAAIWSAAQPRQIRSVVVLPFRNLTGNARNDYLSDGITEQLTDSLARVGGLRVVARTSAFQYKDKDVDVRQIGRQLDADAVVEGSLRTVNGQLRLTVQVNRSANGYHILSQTFDGGFSELGRMEGDMVLPVLAAIRPGAALPRPHPANPEAYDLFLKARALRAKGTVQAFDQALTYLNQAIEKDPNYAEAYAAIAGAYASAAANYAHEPLDYARKSKAAAATALALDPASAAAYGAIGFVDGMILLDWKRGEEELRNAIRLTPSRPLFHNWLGLTILAQGRIDEALPELRKADNLDPLAGGGGVTVGLALEMGRRYDQALQQLNRVLSLHPDLWAAHPFVGDVWTLKGAFDKAMAEYQMALPKDPDVQTKVAYLLAMMGKTKEARRMLAELEHPGPGAGPPDAFEMAKIYCALGDRDAAFAWLNRSYEQRTIMLLKVHPMLDPLRGDPRYLVLLNKAGLA